MYGWRGRIGLILASTNAVTEGEAYKMTPDGVSVHFTRISYRGQGDEADDIRLRKELESAAGLLAGSSYNLGVDVVGLMHGSASADPRPGFDETLNERMFKVTGVPSITQSSAVVQALKKLSIKRVSTGIPLDEMSTLTRIKAFLEASGFEVRHQGTLRLKDHHLVCSRPPETAYKFIKSLDRDDVDAIVMNNANLRTLEVIEPLERDLGKPIITGNQALMWACIRKLGIHEPIPGLGKLFLI
jgi:maleate isomerase